jgi:hypothetical protein
LTVSTAYIENGRALGIKELEECLLLYLEHPLTDCVAETRRVFV